MRLFSACLILLGGPSKRITNTKYMNEAQIKIQNLTETYKKLFPDEYQAVIDIVKDKRNNLRTEFADVKGSDSIDRQLNEMPATLFEMLHNNLQPEEFAWFSTKEGTRWFTNLYKEFMITSKI